MQNDKVKVKNSLLSIKRLQPVAFMLVLALFLIVAFLFLYLSANTSFAHDPWQCYPAENISCVCEGGNNIVCFQDQTSCTPSNIVHHEHLNVPNCVLPSFIPTNLNQYKSDGEAAITETAFTTEDIVVLRATASSPNNLDVKIQVELREFFEPFTGNNDGGIIESPFIPSGQEAVIARDGLVDGTYHWRARAIDTSGNVSSWQEFGTEGNVDFKVRTVPLYTQRQSPYPSIAQTDGWDNLPYAGGRGNIGPEDERCGEDIEQCGCAITSVVMIARYYEALEAQGDDVNPGTINEWLNDNNGYNAAGDLKWSEAAKYTENEINYVEGSNGGSNYAYLNDKLSKTLPEPVILYESFETTGERSHFLVASGSLANNNYNVRDPFWYNTQALDEPADNRSNHTRDYSNIFTGVRFYKKGDGNPQEYLYTALASPAEIIITDPSGRKLGTDPITDTEFNQVPNGSYFADSIGDPTGVAPNRTEESKSAYISDPMDGEYLINVIPLPGALPEDTYNLTLNSHDGFISLAQENSIQNIPEAGYTLRVQDDATELVIPVQIRIEPEIVNLSQKGQFSVFLNIEDSYQTNLEDIDISSVSIEDAKVVNFVLNEGKNELILTFNTQDLENIPTGSEVELKLTGAVSELVKIEGMDSLRVINKGKSSGAILNTWNIFANLFPKALASTGNY